MIAYIDIIMACLVIFLTLLPIILFNLIYFNKPKPIYERVERQNMRSATYKRIMEISYWTVLPFGKILTDYGIQANTVSLVSLFLGIFAGIFIAFGNFGIGAFFFFLSGILDVVDGLVAKESNIQNPSGAIWDSSIDRYIDFFVLAGIAIHYRSNIVLFTIVLFAILGSFMVSYSTALAQISQVQPPRGGMKRTERGPLFVLGSVLSSFSITLIEKPMGIYGGIGLPMVFVVSFIAVFSNFSAIKRLRSIVQLVDKEKE